MFAVLETIHALGLVSCFALLGTSRLGACIRWLSFQGILFGLVPLFADAAGLGWRAGTSREVQPCVSFVMSVLFGIVALGLSVWIASELKPALRHAPFVMLDSAIFLIVVGLFLIISRRNALMQVIGYLVLENGIFVFGVITVVGTPLLVELGVLLDAFVGVFVMGIAIYHINREFGSIDVDRLSALKG